MLPMGKYRVFYNGEEQLKTFLPTATYRLDLRAGHAFDFEISEINTGKGKLTIRVIARGNGTHHFSIRTDNLKLNSSSRELILKPAQSGKLEWPVVIDSPDIPWVAVLIPDDDLSARKEITGSAWEQ